MKSVNQSLHLIFAGSGEFGSPTLRSLLDTGHQIVQVFTQPDRPAGRGKKLTPTPIAQLATERGLPLVRTGDINREPLPVADAMVVIAFGQKIGPAVIGHPRLGSLNLHASRLPQYRGAAPINRAILGGETITGNSVIRLADRMDAGAILAQSELTIGETETAGELHDRLALDGAPLVLRVLEELAAGAAQEREQDPAAATTAPKLSREMATLDWSQPARTLARWINGLSPWPGCRVRLIEPGGQELGRLTFLRARSIAENASGAPGEILESGHLATGEGTLEVLEVQPEGKRPMPLADYRRGHRWAQGTRVETM
jgi:methionyl-tRNA formyltransferase